MDQSSWYDVREGKTKIPEPSALGSHKPPGPTRDVMWYRHRRTAERTTREWSKHGTETGRRHGEISSGSAARRPPASFSRLNGLRRSWPGPPGESVSHSTAHWWAEVDAEMDGWSREGESRGPDGFWCDLIRFGLVWFWFWFCRELLPQPQVGDAYPSAGRCRDRDAVAATRRLGWTAAMGKAYVRLFLPSSSSS